MQEIDERIKLTGSASPRLCSLLKMNQPELTLQAIQDISESTYHYIAQRLADPWESVRIRIRIRSPHETFEFIDYMKEVNVNDNLKHDSYDHDYELAKLHLKLF